MRTRTCVLLVVSTIVVVLLAIDAWYDVANNPLPPLASSGGVAGVAGSVGGALAVPPPVAKNTTES